MAGYKEAEKLGGKDFGKAVALMLPLIVAALPKHQRTQAFVLVNRAPVKRDELLGDLHRALQEILYAAE
jgi:hypothetical protein